MSPILLNLCKEYITKEALEGCGDFKKGGQVIRTVKYVDDLVLVTKEATVCRLIEIGVLRNRNECGEIQVVRI